MHLMLSFDHVWLRAAKSPAIPKTDGTSLCQEALSLYQEALVWSWNTNSQSSSDSSDSCCLQEFLMISFNAPQAKFEHAEARSLVASTLHEIARLEDPNLVDIGYPRISLMQYQYIWIYSWWCKQKETCGQCEQALNCYLQALKLREEAGNFLSTKSCNGVLSTRSWGQITSTWRQLWIALQI